MTTNFTDNKSRKWLLKQTKTSYICMTKPECYDKFSVELPEHDIEKVKQFINSI
jgi:hypothetical protein